MEIIGKALVLVKRIWRFVYASILEFLRRVVPEPLKSFGWKFLHWRERKVIAKNQEILFQLLSQKQADHDYRAIIIFPPSLDWNVQLFQRPQQLAIALARQGALVFYIQPKPNPDLPRFELIYDRLYLCHIHADTFRILPNVLIYLLTWNSSYAARFIQPRIIYDYVDNIDAFYGDKEKIRKGHQYLLKNAEFVLATARKLIDEARLVRPDAIFSPNGVVYENFSRAARREFSEPPDEMKPFLEKSEQIIGYYGALARWFDYDLLKKVAELRPHYQFVLIGPDYDGTIELAGLPKDKNIHCLGVKPYSELPRYLQFFDVATIPFVVNEITHATSPLKLFEYMAAEKPIVITPMQESMHYPGVFVGDTPVQFASQLDHALQMRGDPEYLELLRVTARENTWERRAEEILSAIENRGS